MGWAVPRVLCEALLARLARFLIILLQDALAPITSPFWRSPERSGRGISRYVRGICFSPCLPSTHPPATQKSATTLSPFMGEITIGSTCRPHPPQQMPRLPIALPPRELALNIRIEPQILASRKRLHRNHIPHITRLNVHHQRINLLRRISRLPLPIHAINRLDFVSARMHYLGRLELHPPQF